MGPGGMSGGGRPGMSGGHGGHGGPAGAAGAAGAGGPGGRPGGFGRPGGGPPHMMMLQPTAKAKDFKGSFRRLVGLLRPERPLIILVIVLGVIGVTFGIVGPRILGNATNMVFEGVVGRLMPAGVSKDQAVAGLRARGQDNLADMLAAMNVVPGQGVDFGALGGILLFLVGVYAISAAFAWGQSYLMSGVTQRTVYRLRGDADRKLGRLPLAYFDRQSRGDILSRITNDIDNIAQTLQQSLTQLITSLLTVIGVLIMMLTISPVLAGISLLMVPVSVLVTIMIAKRSQKQFAAQWERTGALNGHIEEMHTGHSVVKVFGRQPQAIAEFDRRNELLFQASYRAQFISGLIQPALNFLANLNYVAIAVIGGLRVASGQMTLGDVVAFIQYSRQFTMPIVQTASIANVLQSAVASA
jgi:ATP-binding cassette subfamily B multidrug efflux pump